MALKQYAHTFVADDRSQIDIPSLLVATGVYFEADKAQPIYTKAEADEDRTSRSYMVWNSDVQHYETYDEFSDAVKPLVAKEWGCTHFYWFDPHFDCGGNLQAVTLNIVYGEL